MILLNTHPDLSETPPWSLTGINENTAFFLCLLISVICLAATISNAASMQPAPDLSERNYYTSEVQVVNSCLPVHMGRYGEPGTPENGWYETLEKCRSNGTLETKYGAPIQSGVSIVTYASDGRVDGVLGASFESVPAVKAKNYSLGDATRYAKGIAQAMATYLNGRGLAGDSMVRINGNCLTLLVPEIIPLTRNMIDGTHYQVPFLRVVETNSTYCMGEP